MVVIRGEWVWYVEKRHTNAEIIENEVANPACG